MWKLFLLFALTFASGDNFFSRNEYRRTQLGNAVDKASMRLLKDLYEESTDKNVISSPLGVLMLLSLYSTGASETNREQIVKLLGLPDYKQMTNSYSLLSEKFISMNPDLLTLANKVYVSNRYALNDHFSTVATRDYYSEVETLNFTDSHAAAAAINEWADRKTHGNIKNPVSADMFTPDTAAALFNVIYFQGHWGVPFRKADTKEKKFYISKSETIEKPTMHLLQSLFYKEDKDLGARMIELPYKEPGFRMIVVLPDTVDGLPAVLEKLSQKGILEDVFALSPADRDVYLDMPKFDVKSKFNLKNILNKEGVGGIFSEESPGVVKGQGVKVSEVFQEAFVKVDEEGATAGAFTGVLFIATSALLEPPQPLEFKVDRPFLYMILNEDIVLFAGTYSH